MEYKDYEEIKNTFLKFTNDWQNKNIETLHTYIEADVKFYISTCKDYTDGGKHSLNGISDFINEIPETSYFRLQPYNFLTNSTEDTAYMTAIVCGVAASIENWKTCEFVFNIAAAMKKTDSIWKFYELRMDLTECDGDFVDLINNWYIGDSKAYWFHGVHLPMISGELDSVVYEQPLQDKIYSDEENIEIAFYLYAFGIDTNSFHITEKVLSNDCIINMAPFGIMDKRTALQSMKLHHGPNKYWTHPGKIESIKIDDDIAYVRVWRMAGHKQRRNPLILTPENINHIYACARYEIKMRKENDCWLFLREDYYLGILDTNN